ncbi:epoxide hydrolase [Moniliophthora roreri MCA 2997]|uniref:Epoxide hydrolase n=2 Tax=Moniliophthora roreri TaxID=221103 RepID=V2WUN1_MONRO|nr:epoxide hydrolase [Moniliophthora roreri MCA 2997]
MSSPFKIVIPDSSLEILKKKLELARLPDEIDEAGWDYGVPLSDIRRLVARWKDGYDWRKHEKALNEEMPQFTRDITVEGHGVLNIHYVHKESKVKGAIPLLFVHGWPGSFIEVRKILPLLIADEPGQPSFHVVALGLPGYGFSEGTKKKGFNLPKYAEVGHKLMQALGYNEYVTQGGDWGALITRAMANEYGGKYIKAWHTNMPCNGHATTKRYDPSSYDAEDLEILERAKWFQEKGSGYFKEQSTQPQTIGYSLADSPVGLLAWIYEKLVACTDAYPWDDDEVLTWISIYWFSRSAPAASVRIYYEVGWTSVPMPSIPAGYSFFPKEPALGPKPWYNDDQKVVFKARHEHGGHFAAHEQPVELVGDLREMFGKGGPAYGVVPGKDGYA